MIEEFDGTTLTIRIPMRFGHYRGRKRIVTPDGSKIVPPTHPQPDNTLVKALARAWRWQKLIDKGKYLSVKDIAEFEGINKSYVSRILRLATLAPDLVEAVLAGRAGENVTLDRLEKGVPMEWEEQRISLKFFRVK